PKRQLQVPVRTFISPGNQRSQNNAMRSFPQPDPCHARRSRRFGFSTSVSSVVQPLHSLACLVQRVHDPSQSDSIRPSKFCFFFAPSAPLRWPRLLSATPPPPLATLRTPNPTASDPK